MGGHAFWIVQCSSDLPTDDEQVFRRLLHKFVTLYLDDVCMYNRTLKEHIEHLCLVIQRFKEKVLKLRPKKCFLALQEMEYLGYTFFGEEFSRVAGIFETA
jgi:hypothetical protein